MSVNSETPHRGIIYKKENKDSLYTKRGYGKPFSAEILQHKAIRKLPLESLRPLVGLSGNTILIALLLYRQVDAHARAREWPAVKLPIALFNVYGFNRQTVSRALRQLERAELIRVHRKPGSRSTVTVLWHPTHELCSAPDEVA